ncbi:MAG: hypothetical protein HWN66_12075 [Candidatus Helarchaeota archaeon]|nr:hypothetical protein [Candidatus Helarchaeota archaeon]
MDSNKEAVQEAINRALKAANRAVRGNKFAKVADIYYRIASMLNEMGDDAGAQNFANAAKKFKEKREIVEQIQNAMNIADGAYEVGDFKTVSETYFKVSSLSELIGDKTTADRFRTEAEKFAQTARIEPQMQKTGATTMQEFVPNIQSQIPSTFEIKKTRTKPAVNINHAMMTLGLVCPHCGAEIGPDLNLCPKCNKQL